MRFYSKKSTFNAQIIKSVNRTSLLLKIGFLGIFLLPAFTKAQIDTDYLVSQKFEDQARGDSIFRLVFYNVENLFDTKDDLEKKDDEFLPQGAKHYSWKKYKKKSNMLAKTMIATGGWQPTDVICLAEVENRYVLEGLTKFSPLKKYNYSIIHKESPDKRGIDVAVLYQKDKIKILDYQYINVTFPFDTGRTTRDILYVTGELKNGAKLHIFANHWPSRWGGHIATEPKRKYVASLVKAKVDSILKSDPNANIVVTGDLNDEPEDKSILETLKAKHDFKNIQSGELYNLMSKIEGKGGTHSFAGKWGILDHFIVSGNILLGNSKLKIKGEKAQIFDAPFLLTENSVGTKVPFRTYQGPKYVGGFSDHLPILIDILLLK